MHAHIVNVRKGSLLLPLAPMKTVLFPPTHFLIAFKLAAYNIHLGGNAHL
jgi:hypothetical protein